jgi:diguanylate cyclase (GGDEF)-like protein/PAS domain S-box-containing protein
MSGAPRATGLERRGQSRDLTVGEIMSTRLLECSPDTPVAEAARRMSASRNSSILVRDGDALLGIWTERDALRQDIADAASLEQPVSAVMSSPVATVPTDLSVSDAAARFKRQGFRHYAVVDPDGRPCGLITQSDVVLNHGVEWFMRLQPVRSVLEAAPSVAGPDLLLSAAARQMHQSRHDALLVRDPEGTPGILTERDVVRYIAARQGDQPAWQLASRPLQTVTPDDSLFHARNLMLHHGFRHLGVIEHDGRLAGLIGFSEILETIEHAYIEELEMALAERDQALRASEERYRALVELSPDAIAVHRDRRILFINPAGARLLGADSPSVVTGRLFDDFLRSETGAPESGSLALEREQTSLPREERLTRLDGNVIDIEVSALGITYNDEPAWQVVMRDITRRKELEDELRRLASTDQLTGIHNRPHFESHLDQAVSEAGRYGLPLALLMFDLDHFKQINDALGHDTGDAVLRRVVDSVREALRDSDIFARWGGEEFMVLAPGITTEGASRLAEKLRSAVRAVSVEERGPITASFGVAVYRSAENREQLLKRVDDALYAAKRGGRDRTRFAE